MEVESGRWEGTAERPVAASYWQVFAVPLGWVFGITDRSLAAAAAAAALWVCSVSLQMELADSLP